MKQVISYFLRFIVLRGKLNVGSVNLLFLGAIMKWLTQHEWLVYGDDKQVVMHHLYYENTTAYSHLYYFLLFNYDCHYRRINGRAFSK